MDTLLKTPRTCASGKLSSEISTSLLNLLLINTSNALKLNGLDNLVWSSYFPMDLMVLALSTRLAIWNVSFRTLTVKLMIPKALSIT